MEMEALATMVAQERTRERRKDVVRRLLEQRCSP
jgi:hypothetical protein